MLELSYVFYISHLCLKFGFPSRITSDVQNWCKIRKTKKVANCSSERKKELSQKFGLYFTFGILDFSRTWAREGKKICPVTVPSPLSGWWDGDLERLFSLRSFLNNRLTKVLDRCRLVLPSAERFSFCCLFFFCLSSKGGKKKTKYYELCYINPRCQKSQYLFDTTFICLKVYAHLIVSKAH